MTFRFALAIGLVAFAVSSPTWADHHETSTFKDFQEFGKLITGRWVTNIKFIADWPGEEKGRGERVTGYSEYTWVVDKKAVQGKDVGGNNSGLNLIVWDAAAKQIKFVSVSTNGGTLQAVLWKKSGSVFAWKITGGGLADGRAHGGTGEWVFSKDGKTMTVQGQTTLAGKNLDPLKDTSTRLDK